MKCTFWGEGLDRALVIARSQRRRGNLSHHESMSQACIEFAFTFEKRDNSFFTIEKTLLGES